MENPSYRSGKSTRMDADSDGQIKISFNEA
jgi:hypothetical protein